MNHMPSLHVPIGLSTIFTSKGENTGKVRSKMTNLSKKSPVDDHCQIVIAWKQEERRHIHMIRDYRMKQTLPDSSKYLRDNLELYMKMIDFPYKGKFQENDFKLSDAVKEDDDHQGMVDDGILPEKYKIFQGDAEVAALFLRNYFTAAGVYMYKNPTENVVHYDTSMDVEEFEASYFTDNNTASMYLKDNVLITENIRYGVEKQGLRFTGANGENGENGGRKIKDSWEDESDDESDDNGGNQGPETVVDDDEEKDKADKRTRDLLNNQPNTAGGSEKIYVLGSFAKEMVWPMRNMEKLCDKVHTVYNIQEDGLKDKVQLRINTLIQMMEDLKSLEPGLTSFAPQRVLHEVVERLKMSTALMALYFKIHDENYMAMFEIFYEPVDGQFPNLPQSNRVVEYIVNARKKLLKTWEERQLLSAKQMLIYDAYPPIRERLESFLKASREVMDSRQVKELFMEVAYHNDRIDAQYQMMRMLRDSQVDRYIQPASWSHVKLYSPMQCPKYRSAVKQYAAQWVGALGIGTVCFQKRRNSRNGKRNCDIFSKGTI